MFENILFATTASPTCDDAAKVAFDLALKYESKKLSVFHDLGVGFSEARGESEGEAGPDASDEELVLIGIQGGVEHDLEGGRDGEILG